MSETPRRDPVIQYWRAVAFQALNERDELDRRLKAYEERKARKPEESWAAANRGMHLWLRGREHPLLMQSQTPSDEENRVNSQLLILPEMPSDGWLKRLGGVFRSRPPAGKHER